jgi:hypothetical protein
MNGNFILLFFINYIWKNGNNKVKGKNMIGGGKGRLGQSLIDWIKE